MNRFYLSLWFFWALRLTLESLTLGAAFALFTTLLIYLTQGLATLDEKVIWALFDIFKFWFMILYNVALLIVLFRSIKWIFNSSHASYKLELLKCPKEGKKEVLEVIGYGDLVGVWRKWFILLIWLVASEMVVAFIFTYLFSSYKGIFEWFNIYVLYTFVLIAGYFSFMLLSSRCKQVRISRC